MAFGTRLGNPAVAEKVRIDSSGNVGIGTTAPLGKLKIAVGDNEPASSGDMNTGVVIESAAASRALNLGVDNTAGYSWINAAFANNSGIADNLVLMTGTTERMRIDSSGDVTVGSFAAGGSASADLQVMKEAANTSFNVIESSDSGSGPALTVTRSRGADFTSMSALELNNFIGRVNFNGYNGSSYVTGGQVIAVATGNWASSGPAANATEVQIKTTSASTLTTNTTFEANGNVTIEDGNLIIGTDGHGINFGAVQGSGATSDLLDDYEEGTFTPIFKAGDNNATFTYNTQIGVYTKIGNRVFVDISVGTTSRSGGTGHFKIAGLPFQINNTTGAGGGSPAINNIDLNGSESCCNLSVEFHNTQSEIYTLQTFDNGGWANIQIGSVPTSSSTNYRVSFAYSTNS